jgi:hypothetical protein
VTKARIVTSAANALDSLERLALELELEKTRLEEGRAESSPALKGLLAWGWHAAALLAYMRLQPQRKEFDAWIWDYLDEGEPALDVVRDSHWEERQRLSLLELLDILSEVDLPLLKPEFYQGWQDRTERCKTLRRQAAAITGFAIGAEQRDSLLVLLAAYHRLLRFPVPVELEVRPVLADLPRLLDLVEALVVPSGPRGDQLTAALGRCRKSLT